MRRITRDAALSALREAADDLGITPETLTAAGYRRYRVVSAQGGELPSQLAISMAFGGWQRACEQAGTSRSAGDDAERQARRLPYRERSAPGPLTHH